MFKKKKPQGKLDKIVTGLIIGGAIASICGVKRSRKKLWANKMYNEGKNTVKKSYSFFGKLLASFVSLFSKKK